MLKNYIKIALRNLLKNKVYTVINILGLSVGLACCIIIALHVQDELTYDEFYENADQLYRVALERKYPDHVTGYAYIPGGFAEVFENEIPEVNKATRLAGFSNFSSLIEYEDKVFEESLVFFADSNFFDVFDFQLLLGDPNTVLTKPSTFILTESTARKYFGNENPVGKSIEIDGNPAEVVGVMQDIPENSHIQFDFLGSTTNVPFLRRPSYTSFSSYTYLELAEGADPARVEAKLPPLVERYASGQIERNLGVSYEDYVAAGNGYFYYLQRISDIHLHSNLQAEMQPNGSITYVYIFLSISIFILLIACINFVNMATARSAERAKEVGIRKVMGSERSQLIRQFLMESTLITFISLVIAVGIMQVVLPFFNNMAGKELSMNVFGNELMLPMLAAFVILVGLTAGLYPALYLSSLEPVQVMKGKYKSSKRGSLLRNGLVVFQFAISIVLISGTLVVYDQMQYIQNRELGFTDENVLVIGRANTVEQLPALKRQLRDQPGIINVAGSSTLPGGGFFGISFRPQGGSDALTTKAFSVDDYFLETMSINVMAGRGFSENFNDSLAVVLNQTAVSALGIENPVGTQLISTNTVNNERETSTFTVIGVVEDFNFESLHTGVTPLAILSTEGFNQFQTELAVKFSGSNFQKAVETTEETWNAYAPDQPFIYSFLDENLASLYEAELTFGKVFAIFALLAIIVACVGLFGLASYTAYQRTKEIGVRKVLGATVPNIVLLLSKDFVRLVGIAFVIAVPAAWYIMQTWLQNFAFRIDLGIEIFLWAGFIALGIALATVSYQSVKAALMNPVKSLRSE